MAIASSGSVSIGSAAGSGRSINVEVGRTQNTANSTMTAVVTAAVTGSTPRGSGSVTDARPHSFSEWHSYAHATDLSVQEYLTTFIIDDGGWPQIGYGLWERAVEQGQPPEESEADGGIYLFTKQVGGSTWVYADRLAGISDVNGQTGRRYTAWSGSTGTFDSMGSNTTNNGTSADVIIKIDEGDVTVTASASAIHGWGDEPYLSGKDTPNISSNSGATYVAGSAQGAADVAASGGGGQETSGIIYRLALTASKAGYNDTPLDGGLTGGQLGCYSYHEANSDEEEGGG